jgi:hypothetical protein
LFTPDSFVVAQVIINKHNNEAQVNRYWTDLMSGIQLEACPTKDISFVRDFLPLVQSVTVKDLQLVLNTIELDEDRICTCIAISDTPTPSELAAQNVVHAAPIV